MTMHRAHVASNSLIHAKQGAVIDLADDVYHRLSKVVRVSKGEVVELFDGSGLCVRGYVIHSENPRFQVESVEHRKPGEPKLTLVQALVAPAKLEQIVQDATELGVNEIVLFSAKNSVTKVTKRTHDQVARLSRIVTDASRQSERADVPHVIGPLTLSELISAFKERDALVLVGEPRESMRLTDAVKDWPSNREIILVIGPEGGLSQDELEILKQTGAKTVCYAPHVLRTETAGIVGLSIIQSLVR